MEWVADFGSLRTGVSVMLAERAQRFNPTALCYHYSHMARRNAREYLLEGQVRLTKYFYVLRPLLAIRYIENGRGIPPVRFDDLVLVRHALIHDAGLEINPMIVEGQGHGGMAQGIGQAMCEDFVYEESGAQILSGSFMDYCLPRADDLPNFDLGSNPTAAASDPLGVKGGGEGGTTPALGAFFNALHDALAPLGIEEVPMPATPLRVWELIISTMFRRQTETAKNSNIELSR